ncbi:deoxyribose-phosphate aldolase [Ferruginibacter sp. HRS2-29]|uniref:deoxyribose-phosphate aldolase n=1 Tax=Ferruginibacter sp. HRS2-29 TaxID=2487334 RepID=UPI0020CECF18|nr:deoxyribose-phosphate aldolase [Ferruginibacter sp. HRS2-29]MCP9751891.1 deoxyribose-phosphate aldolase [Ferruginibacter sp. HRS2-29]
MSINSNIIASITSPVTTLEVVEKICDGAKENNFPKICVPPLFIKKTKEFIGESNITLATVIGFPFGYSAVEAKLAEIVLAILDGADELDVVINIAALKNNDWQYLAHELNAILPVVKSKQKSIGIILETGLLTDDEITKCCDLYGIAGVDFIITSTGYSDRGASRETIKLIRKHLADAIQVVASGNVNDPIFAKGLLEEGAAFIWSSHAEKLIKTAAK